MSLHNRIKEARTRKGLTQSELGSIIGVAKTTVAGYERQYEPNAAQIGAIADALDVDVSFLLQDEIKKRHELYATPDEMEKLVKKYRFLDDYGKTAVDGLLDVEYKRVADARRLTDPEPETTNIIRFRVPQYREPMSAGFGDEIGTVYAEDIELIKEPPRGTSFIARIDGDSMEPTYHNGDWVFVHSQNEIRLGQVGVFFMDGKEWIKELGDGELISHNPEYPTREMTEDVRCQGIVLGVCDESYFE